MISHIKGLKINIFGKITFFTHLPLSRIAFVWEKKSKMQNVANQ